MTDYSDNSPLVTCQQVPEDQRLEITADLFGMHFPLHIEPTIYGIADQIAPDYSGGFWEFFTLSNGGFFMSAPGDRMYAVECFNGYRGDLSPQALGITVCLTAYSFLSFSGDTPFARTCSDHYYKLREFMFGHEEVAAILRAID
jgi:hypothetical protein